MAYDIDPQDIDPDTGLPYTNYSSPSLDTDFHDREMDVDPEARPCRGCGAWFEECECEQFVPEED